MGLEECKEELLSDFSLQKPRVLLTDRFAIVDHVQKLLLFSPEGIAASCGVFCAEVQGEGLVIERFQEGRMEVRGKLEGVRMYPEEKRGAKRT